LPTQTQPALLFYANFGQKLNLAFALLNGAQLFARRQFRDVEILCDVALGAIFNKKYNNRCLDDGGFPFDLGRALN
jgi:hypothetical protein